MKSFAGRAGGGRAVGPHVVMSQRPPRGQQRPLSAWCSQEGTEPREVRCGLGLRGRERASRLGLPPRPCLPPPCPAPRSQNFLERCPCPRSPAGEPGALHRGCKLATSFCLSGNPLREKCEFRGFIFSHASVRDVEKGRAAGRKTFSKFIPGIHYSCATFEKAKATGRTGREWKG